MAARRLNTHHTMFQLFLQSSAISADEWEKVYPQIVGVAEAFPLRLLRIEAYNGFERDKQDKDHFDLIANRGQQDEHLSFYGDWMSWTAGNSVRFFKDWQRHCEQELSKPKSDPSKPITWYPPGDFKSGGSLPFANGAYNTAFELDPKGGLYRFVWVAIGIILEKELPGRAFMTARDETIENILHVVEWMEGRFGTHFPLPLYFDQERLLHDLKDHYDAPEHLVERLACLYPWQFKQNMTFALEHIGYDPTFRFYAEVLSACWFGTFGFSDVLNAWIAATQDLESALDLIAESKRLRLERGEMEQAAQYNLNSILKNWLGQYILWSPSQREELCRFHTNENALERGREDLWGALFRMTGLRIDICPIEASPEELFEAFMYHDPRNGAVFRNTIDEWLDKNGDAYERLLEKLPKNEEPPPATPESMDADEDIRESADEAILSAYPPLERPFLEAVLRVNPAYFHLDEEIDDLFKAIRKMISEDAHQDFAARIRAESNADKKSRILHQLKEKRMVVTAGAAFETWIAEEDDTEALFFLRVLLSLKIYDRGRAYARYRILHDRAFWRRWK